jgi:membrane-bound ClpP family serine protease
MKNKITTFISLVCCIISITMVHAQNATTPAKLVYIIQVDGLVDAAQVSRLDKSFKQKVGIYSEEINVESKTITVKTTEEITYTYICDILSTEGIKAQNYIINKEE